MKELYRFFSNDKQITKGDLIQIHNKLKFKFPDIEIPDYAEDELDEFLTFKEFKSGMMQVINENKSSPKKEMKSSNSLQKIESDSQILDYLRLLEEYRRQCLEDGDLVEAQRSKDKFNELIMESNNIVKENMIKY